MLALLFIIMSASPEAVVQRALPLTVDVRALSFSRDGTRLLVVVSQQADVWDLPTRKLAASLPTLAAKERFVSAARKADGRWLIFGNQRLLDFDPAQLALTKTQAGAFDACDLRATVNQCLGGKIDFRTANPRKDVTAEERELGVGASLLPFFQPAMPMRPATVQMPLATSEADQVLAGVSRSGAADTTVSVLTRGAGGEYGVPRELTVRGFVEALDVSPQGDRVAVCARVKPASQPDVVTARIFEVPSGKLLAEQNVPAPERQRHPGACKLRFAPAGDLVALATGGEVRLVAAASLATVATLRSTVLPAQLKGKAEQVGDVAITTDGGSAVFSLETLTLREQLALRSSDLLLAVSPNQRWIITYQPPASYGAPAQFSLRETSAEQRALKTWSTVAALEATFAPSSTAFAIRESEGVRVFTLDDKGVVKKEARHPESAVGLRFSQLGDALWFADNRKSVHRWVYANRADEIFDAPGVRYGLNGFALNAQETTLYAAAGGDCNDRRLFVFDVATRALVKQHVLTAVASSGSTCGPSDGFTGRRMTVSPDGSLIALSAATSRMALWSTKDERGEAVACGDTEDAVFSKDQRYSIHRRFDGSLCLFDLASRQVAASVVLSSLREAMIILTDGHYSASKGALSTIAFRAGGQVYPVEQFDLAFNRPDLVAARLGYAPAVLKKGFEKAWESRIRKAGFDARSLDSRLSAAPSVSVARLPPAQTSDETVQIEILLQPGAAPLRSLQAWVNDVPLFGRAGAEQKDPSRTLTLALSHGDNKVQIAATNALGVESLKWTHRITKLGAPPKRTRHVVALGVSDYADDNFDLTYAAKDARDLVKRLQRSDREFSATRVLTLTDAEVTLANLGKVRDFLGAAKLDDQVVIFVAGHGVLDDALDYYFATHDMRFDAPKHRGLSYDALEGFFDGVLARARVLLLDTCHSGELDKRDTSLTTINGPVKTRGIKRVVQGQSAIAAATVDALVREQFAALNRGIGARVLSAAGGAEFAFESAAFKNGVFTHAVLRALDERASDMNHDGVVSVNELFTVVAQRVSELTSGAQRPNARSENLEQNDALSQVK